VHFDCFLRPLLNYSCLKWQSTRLLHWLLLGACPNHHDHGARPCGCGYYWVPAQTIMTMVRGHVVVVSIYGTMCCLNICLQCLHLGWFSGQTSWYAGLIWFSPKLLQIVEIRDIDGSLQQKAVYTNCHNGHSQIFALLWPDFRLVTWWGYICCILLSFVRNRNLGPCNSRQLSPLVFLPFCLFPIINLYIFHCRLTISQQDKAKFGEYTQVSSNDARSGEIWSSWRGGHVTEVVVDRGSTVVFYVFLTLWGQVLASELIFLVLVKDADAVMHSL
jgi:hypothetical protein